MPQKITPMLWFDGQAEEAANFYVSVFKDAEILNVYRPPFDYGPDGAKQPAGTAMIVEFRLGEQRFTALNGGPEFRFSEAISFVIDCADQAEVDHYWEKLTDGGEPGPCGWLKDRYGLSWQVTPSRAIALLQDPDPEKAGRAMQAIMQMSKIDIAAVERAAAQG